METESGCITGDAEVSRIQSKLLSLGEGLPNTRTSTELEEVAKSYIIDISDSASEDPHAELIGHQESESVLGNNDNQNNAECQSALVQKVDTNLSDDACSNLISEPDTVSGNHFILSLQTSKNLHCSREDEHREINSQDRLRREQAPPEKELEEGEIEGSDGVPETIEDYGTRKARNRPHKKRLLNITTDSDFSDESIRRIRIKSKLKLRKRRKKIISDLHKIETAKKTKDISKDQENVSQKDRPIEAISGIPTMTINLSKQTTVDTCDTVVIEDDEEEIVEAITKQMPPEILELDDSDEAKTNWTARWLESSHVKKVVTTSKILTNARKKMKMKLKMKEVPEIEAAPLLVVAPELIGSVEEYHRLVKEGVITSSSKDTSSEKKGAAEKSEAMPISEADVECGNKEQIDKANSPNENEMTSDLCFQVELLGEKLDSFEKKTGGKRIVKSDTIVPPSNASIRAPDKESPLAQPLHDENSSIVAGKLDADLIDETVIPKVEGEKMSEVPESNQQPLTSETGTVGNVSDSVNLDPISSSIKSFYEMMNPNQVVGFDLYSKSLSEIPIPPVVSNNYVEESNTTVPNHPIELPLKGTFPSGNADSNTVGDTNRSGPSNNLTSDMIEVNSTLTVDTKNLTAAKPIHLSPGNELEEGEIAESDNEIIATVKTPNNVWVVNRSPQVQSTLTIPRSANVRDNRFDNRISTKLNESSSSAAYTSNSINPFVSTVNLSNQYTPTSGKYVGSLPNRLTNQVVGQSIGLVQCNNIAGSSSLEHPARVVTSTSRSTLSSVVPPSYPVPSSSYNVPGGQATHSIINSTLPNVALSGDAPVVVPINPIQAATAEINSRYPYGDPTGSSTHPQMSVNVNSTLQMYDPYYSWVYRQGLSGSLNSSYGYGIPEQSQDASTIYKQWGEYYKKLMEACQDSAARAGVSTMFEPPKMIESKSYSWVFEHPNQALNEPPTVADTPETSTTAPKEVVSVPSQAPSGEWNYRYGLKGLLNEHFVTPGITPPSTASSNTPQGDIRGRKRAGRGRRKRKKKI
ncbi:hypothetical protein GE061_009501 [Apolygus lucorum]|uniref:Uncharacterized protein n=1 Tax=Apolygus lucorum TaxID=248454 RepID=A0A8S9Y2E9_APOLU|nr:hypothetical protein GE061_009501 [Apolygus lucorum]